MRLVMPDQTKTITLSDGTPATVRKPRGRDLIRAQDIAGGDNKFKFTCAMLAQVTFLNGEPCVMEDIMELWAADIDLLSRETAGDFLSSSAPSSPSSSNGGGASQN
jgi:hypothetical protein